MVSRCGVCGFLFETFEEHKGHECGFIRFSCPLCGEEEFIPAWHFFAKQDKLYCLRCGGWAENCGWDLPPEEDC